MHFENRVQTSFVILMLTGGLAPCLCRWPINKIKFQGKYKGFETDDLIVYSEQPGNKRQAKLLAQIKLSISITNRNKEFSEVMQSAWADFNNKNLFCEGTDIIALICPPLSATDNDVRLLLGHAREAENAENFIEKINLSNFVSNNLRTKLAVFKTQLKSANNNVELTNDQLWRFLKSYQLLIYDVDIEGVTLSLLYSLIEQHSRNNADALWYQIKGIVERKNEYAGLIKPESIPDEIICEFKTASIVETMPEGLVEKITVKNWNTYKYSRELAIACLIGSWDEKSEADKAVISKLAREDYNNWIPKLREALQEPESPVNIKNGIWNIKNRKSLWEFINSRIFDEDLDNFRECAVVVLTETDPKFELSEKDRFSASIYGKVLKHSNSIRKGFAEGLALIGCNGDSIKYCSQNKAENTAILSVREIFNNADWVLWTSLNSLLPAIAESAPNEFLNAVQNALQAEPNPFLEIFNQEGDGITGGCYIAGLLWALETLAWEEQFLVRTTTVLGELASIDPGGKWSNRPSRSLTTIFLPWRPQTLASMEKRKVAIQTLNKEASDVVWKLLISLLPNQTRSTSGSNKPSWRNSIPEGWGEKINNKEYWEQVEFYTEFTVEQAKDNIIRLKDLIEHLDHLTNPAFNSVLAYLSSDKIIQEPEETRMKLWEGLVAFASRHERYSYTKWAISPELVAKIKEVSSKLEPKTPINLYVRLFNGRDHDLFEENGDWRAQAKKLEERRQKALKIILDDSGIDGVFKLVQKAESSRCVGWSLGNIAQDSYDKIILPKFLIPENKKFEDFTSNYVWNRHRILGWEWLDSLDFKDWTISQIARLFMNLPFTADTWDRVSRLLAKKESEYWKNVNINPWQSDADLDFAIDKLIEYGRPRVAIDCLYKILLDKKPLDKEKTIQVLLAAISSSEPLHTMDQYHVVELIKNLQEDEATDFNGLSQIEFAYIQLLDGHQGARPKLLEKRLSTDPGFFCEVIRLLYRSKNEPEKQQEPTEKTKTIASNVWNLLHEWRNPPGKQDDGSFDGEKFTSWLEETKKICTETGHLEVAFNTIGTVLFYSPSDPDGFWINKTVAEALNAKDAEEMRRGFYLEIFNSRGVHWVDPEGKPEKELAAKYRRYAEETENLGYQYFANILRTVADHYEKEAQEIIDRYKDETEE